MPLPAAILVPPARRAIVRGHCGDALARAARQGHHAAGILQARRCLATAPTASGYHQCEETRAIDNLPRILKEVPGIGVVLIGEGDLSQELGHPRDYDHPVVAEAINNILRPVKSTPSPRPSPS
jgi:2-keto-3-deoxy-L-rhamnonate aldolase RhmA